MGKHATHDTHANSVAAWREHDADTREALILSVYRLSLHPMTDREVAERLGFADMNMARPTITRLVQAGRLVECPSVVDGATKRKVRTLRVAEAVQTSLADALRQGER